MLTRFLLQTVAASLGAIIIRELPSPSPWAQLFAETFPTNQLTITAYSTRTPHGENHRIRFGEGSGGDLRGMPPPQWSHVFSSEPPVQGFTVILLYRHTY